MLFFMVDIFQNGDNKNCKSKQHHELFICTHPSVQGSETEVFTPYRLPWQAYYVFMVQAKGQFVHQRNLAPGSQATRT